jgi:four helix bundle protein
MATINSFKDLKCWQECVVLRKMVRDIVRKFPPEEKYKLTDQIIRSSRSTTNNIAEGFGRFHYKENVQFCRVSRGSICEIQDDLIIALEESYISQSEFEIIDNQAIKCLTLVNGYINYLLKAKKENE